MGKQCPIATLKGGDSERSAFLSRRSRRISPPLGRGGGEADGSRTSHRSEHPRLRFAPLGMTRGWGSLGHYYCMSQVPYLNDYEIRQSPERGIHFALIGVGMLWIDGLQTPVAVAEQARIHRCGAPRPEIRPARVKWIAPSPDTRNHGHRALAIEARLRL